MGEGRKFPSTADLVFGAIPAKTGTPIELAAHQDKTWRNINAAIPKNPARQAAIM